MAGSSACFISSLDKFTSCNIMGTHQVPVGGIFWCILCGLRCWVRCQTCSRTEHHRWTRQDGCAECSTQVLLQLCAPLCIGSCFFCLICLWLHLLLRDPATRIHLRFRGCQSACSCLYEGRSRQDTCTSHLSADAADVP